MSGHRPDYNTLKNEHSTVDHEAVAQEREAKAEAQAAQQPTWEDELNAERDARRSVVHEKYANDRISSHDLINAETKIDNWYTIEHTKKMREEAKERGEPLPEFDRSQSNAARGLGPERNINDDRDR